MGEKVNRNYKDGLFRLIFGENRTFMLSLYNALTGRNHTNENDLEITTLSDAIYMKMKNDVSCIVSSLMTVIEHQSTWNPNMPFREFEYCAELYDKHVKTNKFDLYGKTPIRIPAPQCFVLYNGTEERPEKEELRLSSLFEEPVEGYEWTSIVINVNYGHNKEIIEKCEALGSYSKFVESVRVKSKKMSLKEAIDQAIDEAAAKGDDFGNILMAHKAEVAKMCIYEFDEKLHEENVRNEGREEGRTTERISAIQELLKEQCSKDFILKLKYTAEEIEEAERQLLQMV